MSGVVSVRCAGARTTLCLAALLGLALIGSAPRVSLAGGPRHSLDAQLEAPAGWRLVSSGRGVEVFRSGSEAYVVVVDLRSATLWNLTAKPERDAFGVQKLRCTTMNTAWQSGLSYNTPGRQLKAVVSGTFFGIDVGGIPAFPFAGNYPKYATRIPFGIKRSGIVIDPGGYASNLEARAELLVWGRERADIVPYSPRAMALAEHATGGLSSEFGVNPGALVGRNVVAVKDVTGDGQADLVLFYVSAGARQREAIASLSKFGADRMMLLDGGPSANLIVDGQWVVKQRFRPMPHFFAVFEGQD